MADNVEINKGAGTTIATDEVEIAGKKVQVQRVKPTVGVDGAAADVSNENPMPVSDAGLALTIDDGGSSVSVDDNAGSLTVDSTALGTPAEAEASGEGGIIGILKRLRTRLGAGLPGTLTASGNLKTAVVEELPTGTQSIGKVTVGAELPEGSKAIGSVKVSELAGEPKVKLAAAQTVGLEPRTSGGLEKTRLLSAASTNATKVKETAGQVYGWYLFNAGTATRYLKLYNKAAAPTVGTDTPFLTIPVPAGGAANVEFTQGLAFGTGIAFALTKGMADANAEAVAAEEFVVNLFWK